MWLMDIRDRRVRHEEWPPDLEQGGPPDGLHVSPEMPVAIAEVAEPSSSGPWLDLHRHLDAFGVFGLRPELFEQCGEGLLERRAHVSFLRYV